MNTTDGSASQRAASRGATNMPQSFDESGRHARGGESVRRRPKILGWRAALGVTLRPVKRLWGRGTGWAPPTQRSFHGRWPVNRLPRRNRRSRIAVGIRRSRPRRDRQDGQRHRENHPEDEYEPVRFRCHVFLLSPDRCAVADVEVEGRDICDTRHTSVV